MKLGMLKNRHSITAWVMIALVVAILANCTPSDNSPTDDLPSQSSIPQYTPTSTVSENPVKITEIPKNTPDPKQQPPDYRIEIPDFSYQFFSLPPSLTGHKLLAYWMEYKDKKDGGGYLEYLTLDGVRGRLLEITFPTENAGQYWIEGTEFSHSVGTIEDYHSLLVHRLDDEGRRYTFIIDLNQESINGFSFILKDELDCDHWTLGEEYLALACANPHTEYMDDYYGDYVVFFFFIPRADPEQVIFFGNKEGAYPHRYFAWRNGKLSFEGKRDNYCFINVEGRSILCNPESEDFYFGPYLSPDGTWMEVHPRFENHPQMIGLLPAKCLENSDILCEPEKIVSILEIMETWWSNCRGISYAIWTPDSQNMLWITQHWGGAAGTEPCEIDLDVQELWKYDLNSESLERITEYDVVDFDSGSGSLNPHYYYFTKSPTIWSEDGQSVVMIYGTSSGSLEAYYLLSLDDGQATLLGELPGYHLGLIQLNPPD